MNLEVTRIVLLVSMLASISMRAESKVPASEADQLGGSKLNCLGGERSGTTSGVGDYTGKWIGSWPTLKAKVGYDPGPYAEEKPILTVTASNMTTHGDKLTEGQKALLRANPTTYRLNIYPSRRDFGVPKWVCDTAKFNAINAELIDGGLGITGHAGAPAFPMPKSGLEAIFSVQTSYRPWSESATLDVGQVTSAGNISWARNKFMTLAPLLKPGDQRPSFSEKINSYFYIQYLLPARDKGLIGVGFQYANFKDGSTQAWQYLPGTRRVRQAPEVGFDYPVPPSGMHTTDEDYGFNGSPERYDWKLVGKKEIYVPYNNFRINDPTLKYKDLLTPGSVNPDYVRHELHRVWIVDASVKSGRRHIYAKRRFYIDEDTWQILTVDQYDGTGTLWRVPMILYYYSQESSAYHRGVQIFHDVLARSYEVTNLVNERPASDWWRTNQPLTPSNFTPDAAARAGR